jgi:hypothetical protein
MPGGGERRSQGTFPTQGAARLPVEVRKQFLDAIYSGQPFRTVLRELDLTSNQVWGLKLTRNGRSRSRPHLRQPAGTTSSTAPTPRMWPAVSAESAETISATGSLGIADRVANPDRGSRRQSNPEPFLTPLLGHDERCEVIPRDDPQPAAADRARLVLPSPPEL